MPSSACDWSSDVCSSDRSEEHTSELQSRSDLVCRLLLEKKKNNAPIDGPGQNRKTDRTSQHSFEPPVHRIELDPDTSPTHNRVVVGRARAMRRLMLSQLH